MAERPQYRKRLLTHVYAWQNGMVMAFDQFGKQMPDFQGRREDVWPKIEAERERRPEIEVHEDCVWR